MLLPEVQAEILALRYSEKKSIRSIAKQLGLTRKAVTAVINRREVKLEPQRRKRVSVLEPYKDDIHRFLEKDPYIAASTIYQRLREQGFMGGITTVSNYVRQKRNVRRRQPQAYLKLDFAAGECAQVDWGEFGKPFKDGVRIHCFVMVLCYSRLLYLEFTRSEKFEDFIRAHERAFQYFGGVPKECWYDNLATAVSERINSLVRFNARFMAYMGHHGIRPHACNVARGNEKGRVEDGIKYIRSSFWAGRQFKGFDDLLSQAESWREDVCNRREHRAMRKIPRLVFDNEEKPALLSLNPQPFDTDEVTSKVVGPDFHFVYETNKYSVPWSLVGITVTVRIDDRNIRVYYNDRFVTVHTRCYRKHRTISKAEHSKGLLERKPGASRTGWQLQAVKQIGSNMTNYLDFLKSGQRSLRREVAQILALATVYGENEVNQACGELLETGIIGVANLELLLKNRHIEALNPKPLNFQKNKLNRVISPVDLRRYDALLFESHDADEDESVELEGADDERP